MVDLIAVQLYLAGWVCFTLLFWLLAPSVPGFYKRREQEAMKKAFDPKSSRSEAAYAGRRAEKERSSWYEFSRSLEALEATGRLGFACAFIAFFWGGFLVVLVISFVAWAVMKVAETVSMKRVWCDECDAAAPRGTTTAGSRKKAAILGWVVNSPEGEDYCPACAAIRRTAALS